MRTCVYVYVCVRAHLLDQAILCDCEVE